MEFGDRDAGHTYNSMHNPVRTLHVVCPQYLILEHLVPQIESPSLPIPTMATTNPLCQWTGLFWTFPINGMIHYVTFCVWLLSLSIMFSRFIHDYVLWLSNSSVCGWTTFCLSRHQFMDV